MDGPRGSSGVDSAPVKGAFVSFLRKALLWPNRAKGSKGLTVPAEANAMKRIFQTLFPSQIHDTLEQFSQPLRRNNHPSVATHFCKIGGTFSCSLHNGIYYLAISMNFITKLLNCDRSQPWHHIQLCSNLFHLGKHMDRREPWPRLAKARRPMREPAAALVRVC